MNLLYITRKYPPMVGGMEQLSHALANEFSQKTNTTLITWGKSQKYLPYFYILTLVKSLYLIPTKKITHVHIGDGLLSPIGLLLKLCFGVKTTVTIAGLDITFNFPGYQLIIPTCVKYLDKIICISRATKKECLKRGIPEEKCVVIPCGVYPEHFKMYAEKKHLSEIARKNLTDKKVFITVGRLVKRKGVYWFIKHVLPKLDSNVVYLVIGDGNDKERIEKLIADMHFEDRVLLLGKLSDIDLKIIYNTADLFIMPNIKVGNNMEGFGIVAIEASAAGLPVIASNIEGITDAVIHNKTGLLIPDENPSAMLYAIKNIHFNKDSIKKLTEKYFSWDAIGDRYIKAMS